MPEFYSSYQAKGREGRKGNVRELKDEDKPPPDWTQLICAALFWATHRTMRALSSLPGDGLINKTSNLTSTQILSVVDLVQITFISLKILIRLQVIGAICTMLSIGPQLPGSPINGF